MGKRKLLELGVLLGVMSLTVGCHSLFPTDETIIDSRWTSFDDVETGFEKITPYETTVADLRTLGFDPAASPNMKILTYVDIVQTFLPNPTLHKEDLPAAVRECIKVKEKSCAYLVELEVIHNKRHGNLLLDVFGFNRRTHRSGWCFKGLILINGDLVVYKLSSGEPRVARDENKVRPLGPFQEVDFSVTSAVNLVK